jgi:putative two-component system response regulator
MTASILIIEDDEFLGTLASTKLRNEGLTVDIAQDGETAMKWLETHPAPTIILLDLMLPNISGFDVLTRLRENPKTVGTPVMVFSNLGGEEDIQKATELGATEFIIKSTVTLDELVGRVKQYTDQATTEQK